jgi:hypothetical protein
MLELPFRIEIYVCLICIFKSVTLLIIANGAPVIVNKILGIRYNWPIDCKLGLSDGRRVFGDTKTWRGFCSSVGATFAIAPLLNIDPLIGGSFGALAMVGDLLASFIKRRLERHESSQARGLDTVPESFLPIWFLKDPLTLATVDLILIIGVFFLIEEFLSPILYKLNIRMRPY